MADRLLFLLESNQIPDQQRVTLVGNTSGNIAHRGDCVANGESCCPMSIIRIESYNGQHDSPFATQSLLWGCLGYKPTSYSRHSVI